MVSQSPTQGQPTPDEILTALDRTGFILEYRVAQKLRDFGLMTFLNHAFTDPDTGKSREIDVVAHLDEKVAVNDFVIMTSAILVMECKKYEDPLIVIGEEQGLVYNSDPVISFDPLAIDFPKRSQTPSILNHIQLWKLPSHSTRGFIGSQLLKMRRQGGKWQAANDSIYDSIIYPLSKATKCERDDLRSRIRDADKHEPSHRLMPTVYYLFPVVITSGSLYSVDVTPNEAPTVKPVTWAPLVRHFDYGLFKMDVVSFRGIAEYLRTRVEPVLSDARKIFSSNINLFNPEWLIDQYGEPSDQNFYKWLADFRANYRS